MLIEYLPEFLRDFEEFKVLFSALNYELEKLQENLLSVKNNQYILSTDKNGIQRYENMLGISNDRFSDEYRKNILFLKFNEKLPYTKVRLFKHLLALCGERNFYFLILYDEYRIIIRIADLNENIKKEAVALVYKMLPANIETDIVYFNYHRILKNFKHRALKIYTHRQLNKEVLKFG